MYVLILVFAPMTSKHKLTVLTRLAQLGCSLEYHQMTIDNAVLMLEGMLLCCEIPQT